MGGSSGAGGNPNGTAGSGGHTGGDAGDGSDDPNEEDPTSDGGAPNDAGSEEPPPAVWSCDGDYAYGAGATLAFGDPTPSALASALLLIKDATYPISLVLHLEDEALVGLLSATSGDGSGLETLSPSDPPLVPVVAAFGSPPGVTTVDAQPNAMLHFEDTAGPLDIELEHVVWRATQGSDCADMTVSMQAVLPTSQFSLVVHLPDGDQTIGELVTSNSGSQPTPIGNPTPPPTPVEIAVTFKGVPVDFDFDAL